MSAFGFTLLDVERATVRDSALPPAGATSATPWRSDAVPHGGALDVERPGRMGGERAVRAGECQCCGLLVPAAHRLTTCPLCGSPVVRRLYENAPARLQSPGADTGGPAPMPTRPYRFAVDLLDRAWLDHGAVQTVPAQCRCGESLDGRMLVARQLGEDGEPFDTIVEDRGWGDGPTVTDEQCDACGRDLLPDVVVLRDRKHRAAAEIAELQAVA